jgi:hypothetical protein
MVGTLTPRSVPPEEYRPHTGYPYDSATFGTATVVNDTATKVGFNVGADVGFKISRNIGVGGPVRFARASFSLPLTGSASNISVEAGGVQVGGGLRLFF